MNGTSLFTFTEGISEGDFRIFIGMDEDSIKAAYKEWLYRLASKNNWLNKDGKIVIARIAEYFQVSRQTATNWLLGVSCISTQKVNAVISPRMGISAAAFWHEMQLIDRELKGLSVDKAEQRAQGCPVIPGTADKVLEYIKALPVAEKAELRKLYLVCMAEGTL